MATKKTVKYFNDITTGVLNPANEDEIYFPMVMELWEQKKDEIDKPELLELTYNQHRMLKQYLQQPSSYIAEVLTLVYWEQDVDNRDLSELTGRLNFDYELFEQEKEYWLKMDFEEAYPLYLGVLIAYGELTETYNSRLKQFDIPPDPQAVSAGLERLSEFSDLDEINTLIQFTGLNLNQIGDLPYGLCLRILLRDKAKAHFDYSLNKIKYK